MPTTETDPIIAEVQAVRDAIAAQADYDVGAIFRRIRAMQDESRREYVSYPARRIAENSDESLAVWAARPGAARSVLGDDDVVHPGMSSRRHPSSGSWAAPGGPCEVEPSMIAWHSQSA